MLLDYHMHLEKGEFTKKWWEEFYSKELENGIKEVGVSEHAHRFIEARYIYSHLPYTEKWCDSSLEKYINFMEEIKRSYNVKIGLEMDYFPEKEDEIRDFLEKYDVFDYVLGSVHWLRSGFGFDIDPNDPRWSNDLEEIFIDYFDRVKGAINSGLFDIIAHLDLIKLWGVPLPDDIEEIYEDVAKVIANSRIVLEINTSGLRRPVKEIYPSPKFLEVISKYDVPVTFGSDAHLPEDAGRFIKDTYSLVKSLGFRRLAVFNRRSPEFVDL
ncbi:MAG: histidinol-phosphatase [bacterium]|nr:histidinol-phosphatase [bacterium]